MFTLRHVLRCGLFLLSITPVLAQTVDDPETQLSPFHNSSIASFDDVWSEAIPETEGRIFEGTQHPIEGVAAEETVTPAEGELAATAPIADSPRLFPILTAPPSATLPQLLSPTDTIRAAETGLFQWFFGMLGVVGLLALGGVCWIYQVRPALDVRHTASRLQLSSSLALPRRSGLFLVDVEDQTVLVAIDGGGIRQVVPLGLLASLKTTGRRAAADKAQRPSSPSKSKVATASAEVAFHDVYQARRAGGGDARAVLPVAKSATRPQATAIHSNKAP